MAGTGGILTPDRLTRAVEAVRTAQQEESPSRPAGPPCENCDGEGLIHEPIYCSVCGGSGIQPGHAETA